ncbi:MAG: translational GTPase TypA [Bacilli bacterium]|nr:translational GTPase TypA [Bacilli bacterium]
MKIRNIAIIAHVDHGKTTLVDQLLRQSGTFRENEEVEDRVMDSNAIERERGITILAKTTAINYKDYRINILDTPGHADFGGEVERIMRMVDGVLLVIDAFEGTMPQTRFVLKKALQAHVKPIVVVNKVDRPHADALKAVDEALELFIELGADDSLLDFPVVYASALKGTSSYSAKLEDQQHTMEPIFESIIKYIPEPKVDPNGPFQFQPALLDYNDYVGRIGIGRITRGKAKVGDSVTCMRNDGTTTNFRIQKLLGYRGLKRIEIEEADAGDICAIAGLADISVGETICDPNCLEALPPIKIDEPTLQMTFAANDSPFAGREGKFVTARQIQDRLYKETQRDVSLKVVKIENSDSWVVSGRGELHLSILIENMRREGFELQVSKPEVIIKVIDGKKCEPYEDLQIDLPEEYQGPVMEALGPRGAELLDMQTHENQVKLTYVIPSRGLLGFMTDFLTLTKGYGIINHTYREYRPTANAEVGRRGIGVMVATDNGQATHYAIQQLEPRGTLFIEPGAEVYQGMIVGENAYDMDLTCNVCRTKNLSNQRSVGKDPTVVLKRPRMMSLEVALDYINPDELVEVTPVCYRLRKKILDTVERKKYEAHHPLEGAK